MKWTDERKVEFLLRLPWTFLPAERSADGYYVGRVAELPSVIATAEDVSQLERELWEAMEATISCLVEFGDPVPLPATMQGEFFPWDARPASAPKVESPNDSYRAIPDAGPRTASVVAGPTPRYGSVRQREAIPAY